MSSILIAETTFSSPDNLIILTPCVFLLAVLISLTATLITLPLLIFLGLPSAVANGTNRIAIFMSAFSANAGFKSKGISNYPFNMYLGFAGLLGAIIGAQIAIDIKGDLFNKILAVIMIVVVLLIVFKPKIDSTEILERLTGKHLYISMIAFFFIGIYGGFINAGIGFVIIN